MLDSQSKRSRLVHVVFLKKTIETPPNTNPDMIEKLFIGVLSNYPNPEPNKIVVHCI